LDVMFNRTPEGSDMALRREPRRIVAASATLSAGALVFFAATTGPASASTGTAGTAECKLGKLLCGLLGAGKGTPTTPPPTSKPSSRPSSKPSAKPAAKPRPRPRPKPAPAAHGGAGDAPLDVPAAPPAGAAPEVPDSSQQVPALPDVADQDPVVVPQSGAGSPAARLVAESAPDDRPVPPLLVATASGLVGAVAALNLSMVRRRNR
jgi:hypothetical protein